MSAKAAEKISCAQFSDETAPDKRKTSFAAIQDALWRRFPANFDILVSLSL
jgi:hypothetical protein